VTRVNTRTRSSHQISSTKLFFPSSICMGFQLTDPTRSTNRINRNRSNRQHQTDKDGLDFLSRWPTRFGILSPNSDRFPPLPRGIKWISSNCILEPIFNVFLTLNFPHVLFLNQLPLLKPEPLLFTLPSLTYL